MTLYQEEYWKRVPVSGHCKRVDTQNWNQMGLRVHQHVLVVLWEELLHESVASFVNRLNE
jgi:hypothetical protein